MSYLCQKCNKIGGHRLRFRDKTRGKLPRFWKIGARNFSTVDKDLSWVENIAGELMEANDLSHIFEEVGLLHK